VRSEELGVIFIAELLRRNEPGGPYGVTTFSGLSDSYLLSGIPDMQKAQPVRLRFLQQEKRRGKMKKGEKSNLYKTFIARSVIRAL